MQDFTANVAIILKDKVKKKVNPYICETISTEPNLEGVEFCTVNYKEKLGGKDYVVNVLAKWISMQIINQQMCKNFD